MNVNAGLAAFRPSHLFWAAILILALVSGAAAFSTYRLIDEYSASQSNRQALLALDRFISDLKDVESRARGYALTLDPRFLDSMDDDVQGVHEALDRLRTVSETQPGLARRLPPLEQSSSRRLDLASRVVNFASTNETPAQVSGLSLAGEQAMDKVRAEVAAAVAAQERIHSQRTDSLQRQVLIAIVALAAGVVLSGAILIWLFRSLNREVAHRRKVEDELRRLNADLEQRVHARTSEVEQSRRLLDTIIENMPDTIFLKDVGDGFRYVLINQAGEKLLGRDRGDVLGHVDHELLPANDAAVCRRDDEKVAQTHEPSVIPEREFVAGGEKRVIEARKLPLESADGDLFILGIVRDVTDRRSLQKQVREMQRLESVGRLTGGIAHDFNNLLAVIMGSVELVREKLPDGSESAAIADEALDASRRGAELVRRLLAFARKQHLEPVAVDLNERLPTVVPLLQRTLGETIRVKVKSGDGLWPARIDPTQVDDALVNLAINARDAMPRGGTLTIETENVTLDEDYAAEHVEVESGEYVMLAVSDTGTGMTPDVVARAFEPFFTTKAEGKGTGLGLSQVFGWVKQSGGHIKIYSEVAHGTTIKLYLPRAAEQDRDPRAAAEAAATHSPGHETILVVEDNSNVRRTLVRQLDGLGYTSIEAGDAAAALEMIRSGLAFDLLLTDVVMPGGMNGYELAAEAEALRPGTKVLFTSGYTELAATELQVARSGPLISKPATKRELGKAIRSALGNGETSTG